MTSLHIEQSQRFVFSTSMDMALRALEMSLPELALFLDGRKGGQWQEEVEWKISLFEHLMQQARCSFNSWQELQEAEWIVGNIDERGLFTEVDGPFSIPVLEKVRLFDPPGIAASSLRTCLLAQLVAQGKQNTLAYYIIEGYFEAFMHKKWHKIPCTQRDLERAIENDMRGLKLRPADDFAHEVVMPIVADIIVERQGVKLKVLINDEGLPLDLPSWVFKRHRMLAALGNELIERQREYFFGGALTPMTMQEIGCALGVHTSTVARAVSGKYMLSPQGFISIKNLFTPAIQGGISNQCVKKILEKLILSENPSTPFSDEDLVGEIATLGMHCSRRAVAKYRKMLRIPSSYKRSKQHAERR